MQKLLIADVSEAYTDALKEAFENDFDLQVCYDGETALELLQSFAPDALVINLRLPFKDGVTTLMQSAHKPKVILAITPSTDPYTEQRALRAGVQYLMVLPKVEALRVQLMDMVASTLPPYCDLEGQTATHLHSMEFYTHLDGYHQLCVGIPIFTQNPGICLSKELYPAIAKQMKLPDPRSVERSIRHAIENAWKHKNSTVWLQYFSKRTLDADRCPSNKQFISAIAEKLELQPCNFIAPCYNNQDGSNSRKRNTMEEDYETDQCSR